VHDEEAVVAEESYEGRHHQRVDECLGVVDTAGLRFLLQEDAGWPGRVLELEDALEVVALVADVTVERQAVSHGVVGSLVAEVAGLVLPHVEGQCVTEKEQRDEREHQRWS